MLEQPDDASPTAHGRIPFPIASRQKVAILTTIILLSILQITFGAISLPIIYRHSGYGRRGAWSRPWNEDGIPGMAVVNGVISLVTFGAHGLSEFHPRHPCYSRGWTILGASMVFWFNAMLLNHSIGFARHFLSFGGEDRDAYQLGVWTVCIVTVTGFNLVATATYWVLASMAMRSEIVEANFGGTRDIDPLLGIQT